MDEWTTNILYLLEKLVAKYTLPNLKILVQ